MVYSELRVRLLSQSTLRTNPPGLTSNCVRVVLEGVFMACRRSNEQAGKVGSFEFHRMAIRLLTKCMKHNNRETWIGERGDKERQ